MLEIINLQEVENLIARVAFTVPFLGQRVAVFTNGNFWYIDTLIHNLIKSAEIHEPILNIAVFCSDEDAAFKCRDLGINHHCLLKIPDLSIDTLKAATTSDTDGYTRLSFIKVLLCRTALRANIIPLYLDPDMAFKRSGTIHHLLTHLQNSEFVCAGTPDYMNSNILIARPSIRNFFDINMEDIDEIVCSPYKFGDEDYFRPRLYQVKCAFVDRALYPCGKDAFNCAGVARLIHANCVSGLENKVRLLKDCGAWYLKPPSLVSQEFVVSSICSLPVFSDDNTTFEEYFYNYYVKNIPDLKRKYIGATWTNIYCNYNQRGVRFNHLKLCNELEKLPKTSKYFTIVQYDTGVEYHPLPPDTLVFGCCTGDVPIPLTYQSSKFCEEGLPWEKKDILASFIGSITHPIRGDLLTYLSTISESVGKEWEEYLFTERDLRNTCERTERERWKKQLEIAQGGCDDYYVSISTHDYEKFLKVSARSKFCFAPRGFGRASFRFYEVLKLKSVPVYIWDDIPWLPFADKIDYSKLCVVVNGQDITKLDQILRSITKEQYEEMLSYHEEVQRLFTFDGMCKEIVEIINRDV